MQPAYKHCETTHTHIHTRLLIHFYTLAHTHTQTHTFSRSAVKRANDVVALYPKSAKHVGLL